jgi:hypothetical protein
MAGKADRQERLAADRERRAAPDPSLAPCSRCNGSGSEPGPGLRLIKARQRMTRAVLTVQLQEAGAAASPATFAGSKVAGEAYAEMSMAARVLVLAQNAWDDYLEARRAEMVIPWPTH